MPTCGTCSQKLIKSQFSREQLRLGPDRCCKSCVALTDSLFGKVMSTRRFDEVSTDAQVERLRAKDKGVQADAANKLWTLTRRGSEAVDRDIAAAGAIPPLVEMLRARGDDRAWTAAMALQSLSCRSEARKAAIAAAGGIALLHALLSGDDGDDREVAAMCLHNLAFTNDTSATAAAIERQRHILDVGSAGLLTSMLGLAEDGAREAAVATLACLVADDDELRDRAIAEVSAHGGVTPLAAILCEGSSEARLDAGRVLKELARREADAHTIARSLSFEMDAVGAVGDERVSTLHELLDRMALGEHAESRRSAMSEGVSDAGSIELS